MNCKRIRKPGVEKSDGMERINISTKMIKLRRKNKIE